MLHVAEEESMPVYGRREVGLHMERLEPELWRLNGSPPVPPVNVAMRRSDLWCLRRGGLKA